MKKILLFSSILIIACSCKKTNSTPTDPVVQDTLNSWVKYLVTDSTNSLYDVWFINQNIGFTINNYNLFQTSDGGKTWQTGANIDVGYNIQFVDSLNGFIQGNNFYTSGDGGKTWTKKNSGVGIYFQFVTRDIGFSYNISQGLSSTHDGGNNWTSILKLTTTDIEQYPSYFLDSLRGFSLLNGNCYKTRDGGANWDIVSNVTTEQFNGFYKMQFLDTLNGYCGGPNELLKTTDGGKTWTTSFKVIEYNPGIHTFIIPQFFDINNGYFMTNNGIYKTTNGGKDWTTSCRIGNNKISGIHFLDMNTGWASTFDGFVLKLGQ